jgi:hypothetical protein
MPIMTDNQSGSSASTSESQRGEVAHRVSADAPVGDANPARRVRALEQWVNTRDVTVTEPVGEAFADRPGAAAIGHRVANHDEPGMRGDFHAGGCS